MRARLKRILDAVESFPLGVRLAVGALAVAATIAGTVAHERNDGAGNDGANGARVRATAGSQGASRWMPSLHKRRAVIWAVGDAADGSETSRNVASLVISRRPERFLYLGDVYDTGTAPEFDRNYRPLYGGLGDVTAPTIGNHEWPNIATGYVPYWTSVRGSPPPLRYAFTVSGWQLISLNSNLPTDPAQEAWLRDEIERTPEFGTCRIAFMHHPRYSAGLHGDLTGLQGVFDELRGHAAILLAGHDHDMERLHPVDGITQYVDGSGGAELYPVNRLDPRLAFFDDTHHGALRIALKPEKATLTFVQQDGVTLDRSTVGCHQS